MDILIFDMDGVLIDVSRSYRETIQRTVQIYLEVCLGFGKGKTDAVTKEDISLFKSAGGFNNDWDLTAGLLLYLLSLSSLPALGKRKKFSDIHETIFYLGTQCLRLGTNFGQLTKNKDLPSFIAEVKSAGGGLKGVRKALQGAWEGWVYGDGDLNQANVVKRIFQEVYLGRKFTSFYHLPALFYKRQGLYLQEKLIIPKWILSRLRRRSRLGIASGRPRFEAELALKRFGLLSFFDSVVTLDECLEEERRLLRSTGKRANLLKPNPYPLLRVAQEIGLPNPRCAYVGDVVDDMLAANAARRQLDIVTIGFLHGGKSEKATGNALFKAGADLIVKNPGDLLRVLTESSY